MSDPPVSAVRQCDGENRAAASEGKARASVPDSPRKPASNKHPNLASPNPSDAAAERMVIDGANSQSIGPLPRIPDFPRLVPGEADPNLGDNGWRRSPHIGALVTEEDRKQQVLKAESAARKNGDSSSEESGQDGEKSPATLGSE